MQTILKKYIFFVLSAFSVIVPCIHFHSISEVKQRWVRLVFGWVVAEKYKIIADQEMKLLVQEKIVLRVIKPGEILYDLGAENE
jgi:hypothetical protein